MPKLSKFLPNQSVQLEIPNLHSAMQQMANRLSTHKRQSIIRQPVLCQQPLQLRRFLHLEAVGIFPPFLPIECAIVGVAAKFIHIEEILHAILLLSLPPTISPSSSSVHHIQNVHAVAAVDVGARNLGKQLLLLVQNALCCCMPLAAFAMENKQREFQTKIARKSIRKSLAIELPYKLKLKDFWE